MAAVVLLGHSHRFQVSEVLEQVLDVLLGRLERHVTHHYLRALLLLLVLLTVVGGYSRFWGYC